MNNIGLGDGSQTVSLVVLAAMLTASAMGVVLLQNIVYAAFLLGACFISVAGLYLLLNADFVAAAQVLIYVGAVNILILFAIMLVNKRQDYQDVKFGAIRSVVTGVVCLGLFALLGVTVTSTKWAITSNIAKLPSTLLVIGQHFFSDYLLPFELASVLLLVALIGAIVLARREFIPDTVKSQADSEESLELLEKPKEQLVSSK
ncbi:MAG: NADH-quinone oxidoreductase subunit J [Pseudanabaena sp.]|jgi:NAD(P)H-quinone oxidoreductase subunit 6|nr:NADH-quinone oxidoreductase subunit J [Pseudanabaena sp. M53BS1SP1A06MG]MCA6584507.1 NADH-quinone oxidoreductase subunit J [Pseudanabaena sp. M34BS1SP1A06MG]MCA6587598.1 NADH-quinone oxidoreductase subunit J [Pseudanabaena sp. M051S1SP1A06QC]MCA6590244.1 NADH-quinone oxidoreductase subunit J [Pseudanabaena sp. M109S1SP1A06QC]MCA6593565.1 NADH-quinone oxidoreductase subunit J [Pseudanabaena sp. M38BS1SP1A06MG]MCA6597678.1 NADH-quinone oxidoreductase subunit J [Pseudanabaena sp. M046S1SP1A06Q